MSVFNLRSVCLEPSARFNVAFDVVDGWQNEPAWNGANRED